MYLLILFKYLSIHKYFRRGMYKIKMVNKWINYRLLYYFLDRVYFKVHGPHTLLLRRNTSGVNARPVLK